MLNGTQGKKGSASSIVEDVVKRNYSLPEGRVCLHFQFANETYCLTSEHIWQATKEYLQKFPQPDVKFKL